MSRANLEQILELLLAEENEKAEEALHEYVVSKARAEYEKVLDESEEEAEEVEEAVEDETVEEAVDAEEEEVTEVIDQRNNFEDEITSDEEEVRAEEIGEDDDEEEDELDMEPMGDMEMDGEEAGEDDIEDKVDELESELEDLRAEFEKLLADTDEDGDGDHDMDDHEEEEVMDSVEYSYDLGEAEEADSEEIEEATKLSDGVARQPLDGKQVEADSSESPYSKAPKHTSVASQGSPVKAKDGGEGKKGEAAKDHTPTDNIKVEPKKA